MSNLPKLLQEYLKANPLTLLDIGALGGVKEPWLKLNQYLHVLSFEPQEESSATKSFEMDSVALFNTQSSSQLYITKRRDSSSLLEPNREVLDRYGNGESFTIVDKISVQTDTLDNQVQKHGINFIDFIKLDTQGSELQILQKSEQVLATSVFGVEVEVNFIERYKKQGFFTDVDILLKNAGFELFDIQRRYHKRKDGISLGKSRGQLTHGTALYFRTQESALHIINKHSSAKRESLIAHFILCTLVYGYNDFAAEILKRHKESLSDPLTQSLENLIDQRTFQLPHFPGKFKIAFICQLLASLFTPRSKTGKTGDATVGNFRSF